VAPIAGRTEDARRQATMTRRVAGGVTGMAICTLQRVATDDRATDLKERLVDAGLQILRRDGAAELTVRRIAEAAGTSTMGVYSRFGGRTGVLESIYDRGFVLLREAFDALPDNADPLDRILDIGLAYRHFGLANPALYAFLFERPLPDFDPDPQARWGALQSTFGYSWPR
jgi:AcrR family transcriptional regulator